jgi:hypothetical protein
VARSSPGLPKGVPNCLKKRQLLNDPNLSAALCRDYGNRFLEMGWYEDALEFFKKGHSAAGLEKLTAHGLESGDAFLLDRLGPQDPEVWRQAAERALAQDKLQFARRAFEMAGEDDKAAMVAGLIAGQTTPAAATPDETPDENLDD